MSQKITISPWPSTFHSLRWSQDGELAIAIGEYVEIIIPKLRSGQQQQQQQQSIKEIAAKGLAWDHVRLRVNLFDEEESPAIEPAPHRTWSIGEEISIITASAIEWSPPGLARYKRSALGVLTSNHVLSIWAPGACPSDSSRWARELVINKLLRSGQSREGLVADRRSLRVRAFAFGQVLRFESGGAADDYGYGGGGLSFYLLSLVNDVGDIFVVRISSSFDAPRPGGSWSAIVLARCQRATGVDDNLGLRSSILSDYLASNKLIDQLAWSEWYNGEDGTFLSSLAFTSTRVHCCRLRASFENEDDDTALNVGICNDTTLQDVDVYNGPVGWVPRKFLTSTSPLLFSFGENVLHFVEVFLSDVSYAKKFEYDLDDRWDVIAGLAFCWTSTDTFEMNYATHTYSQSSKTLRISLSKNGMQLLEKGNSVWTGEVLSDLSHFMAEHFLPSDPFARVWGMASSPLDDYICTSYSLHPSNMLEYTIPAEQQCFLRITPTNRSSDHFCMPLVMSGALSSGVSTEVSAFGLRLWMKDREVEDVNELAKMILNDISESQDIDCFIRSEKKKHLHQNELFLSRTNSNTLQAFDFIKSLKHNILSDGEYVINRARILVLSALGINSPTRDLSALQLYHVAKCSLNLPVSKLRPTRLSNIIIHHLSTATESTVSQSYGIDNAKASEESCEVCRSVIPFESTEWAICISGHAYSRCSLSMVAIQIPGISKFCGICSQQYLRSEQSNDFQLFTDGHADASQDGRSITSEEDGSLKFSLAQVLFAACDACIYCGGKFLD